MYVGMAVESISLICLVLRKKERAKCREWIAEGRDRDRSNNNVAGRKESEEKRSELQADRERERES